jgi:hypothetical protein
LTVVTLRRVRRAIAEWARASPPIAASTARLAAAGNSALTIRSPLTTRKEVGSASVSAR